MSAAQPLVVVGVGGFGREALDVVQAVNCAATEPVFDVLGAVDDSPSEANLARLARRGIKYLGAVDEWLEHRVEAAYLIGIGSPAARRHMDEVLTAAALASVSVAHPAAGIGSDARLGVGVVMCAGVQVSTNVALGRHLHLNPNVTIGHDSVLEDYVSVNPGAIISGECRIGSGTLVGAGAVVLQGLTVGTNAVVGAAACVTRDVPAGITVKGVPAR